MKLTKHTFFIFSLATNVVLIGGIVLLVQINSKPQVVRSRAAPAVVSTTFIHPGIQENKNQLDFVKAKIATGQEPWKSAFNTAKNSTYGSLTYTPHPWDFVSCPTGTSDAGCGDSLKDSRAAYTDALLWYYTGNPAYAKKSIEIMNAWSATLKDFSSDNAPLRAAWFGEIIVKAGEIIKYTSTDWAPADQQRFTTMLTNVVLPEYSTPTAISNYASYNGNWHLSAINAEMNIAVFTDNRALFDKAIGEWRARVPAYIYLKTDNGGNGLPVPPPGGKKDSPSLLKCHWLDNAAGCATATLNFADGHAQETCRDATHTGMGVGSMGMTAETAYLQGVDLYAEQKNRIINELEYNTQFMNGKPYPPGFCNGAAVPTATTAQTYEILYNHFNGRLGIALPNTKITIDRLRAAGGSTTTNQLGWETLTHADTGKADATAGNPGTTTPLPTAVVPTYVCAGSSQGICATPTPTPPLGQPSTPAGSTQPSQSQPSTQPSGTVSQSPCTVVSTVTNNNHKKHQSKHKKHTKGGVGRLMQQLLALIRQLLLLLQQLAGGGVGTGGTGGGQVPSGTPSGSPSQAPSGGPSIQPTGSPC